MGLEKTILNTPQSPSAKINFSSPLPLNETKSSKKTSKREKLPKGLDN